MGIKIYYFALKEANCLGYVLSMHKYTFSHKDTSERVKKNF